MKIEELQFSLRVYNCLKRKGIDTVEQLKTMSDDDLLKIRCFGIGCLKEVREKLGQCTDNLPKVQKQIPVAEDILKYLGGVPGGVESLMVGLASGDAGEKVVTKMRGMLRAVHELEKEESAEKQAIFRLGQMDMLESVLAMMENWKRKVIAPNAKLTMMAVIHEVKRMGGQR